MIRTPRRHEITKGKRLFLFFKFMFLNLWSILHNLVVLLFIKTTWLYFVLINLFQLQIIFRRVLLQQRWRLRIFLDILKPWETAEGAHLFKWLNLIFRAILGAKTLKLICVWRYLPLWRIVYIFFLIYRLLRLIKILFSSLKIISEELKLLKLIGLFL